MRREGFAREILARANRGGLILGICGGCQMLGETIEDPHAIESSETVARGLGLLPLRTRFETEKTTARATARPVARWFTDEEFAPEITGYEIHMGTVTLTRSALPAFTIISRNGDATLQPDGAVSSAGNAVGTMLHGIFENASIRSALLAELSRRRGLAAPSGGSAIAGRNTEYDRLAATVRTSIDMDALRKIIGL
jgi:adenosylcobyric acid synthase